MPDIEAEPWCGFRFHGKEIVQIPKRALVGSFSGQEQKISCTLDIFVHLKTGPGKLPRSFLEAAFKLSIRDVNFWNDCAEESAYFSRGGFTEINHIIQWVEARTLNCLLDFSDGSENVRTGGARALRKVFETLQKPPHGALTRLKHRRMLLDSLLYRQTMD